MSGESTKARQPNTRYVFAGLGGPRSGRLTLAVVLLAISMIATGAPVGVASQFDDLGLNDPSDVEGVDEPPWRAWHTSTIQGEGLFHKDTAVGPDGEPYITWGVGQIWIGWREPGSAEFETNKLDKAGRGTGGVAVSEEGRIWLVYEAMHEDTGQSEIYVTTAMDPRGPWTTHRLADMGSHPRVALEDDGRVHVVYENFEGRPETPPLFHATYTPNEGWSQEEVTSVPPSGTRGIDLAIEGGQLHAVWQERLFENPTVQEYHGVTSVDGGSWSISEIPTQPYACGHRPDVGASPDGSAWVVCRGIGGVFAFHRAVDGGWSFEMVSDGDELLPEREDEWLGAGTSVAVGSDGVPQVAFRSHEPFFCGNSVLRPGQPQYAARVDGDWMVETVDRVERASGHQPSISLDGDDRPHIAFSLRYRLDPSPCKPCPGCGFVNEGFQLQYAEPVIATAGDVTGLDT